MTAAGGSGIADRFHAELERASSDIGSGVLLLPTCLARAARETLDVSGAALSVHHGRVSVPLGASDPAAAQAERLQFTYADGPSVDALDTPRVIAADETVIAIRWPIFQQQLFAHTPFRALATLPVPVPGDARVVLGLYLRDPAALHSTSLADAAWVCDEIVRVLDAHTRTDVAGTPLGERTDWLGLPGATTRLNAWLVVGIVMERFGLGQGDALALLRAAALSRETTVDALAAAILGGDVDVGDLQP